MILNCPGSRRLALLFLLLAVPLGAQQTRATRLTLGDAARLAARQGAAPEVARLRAQQAEARVTQRRADLLPNASAYAVESQRTFNTVTLGIDLPTLPGQPPLFDPNGQVAGPVPTFDVRGRVSQSLLDLGAVARIRSARTGASASRADAASVAEQAAATAASAYIRALRAEAYLNARIADSVLADSLVGIAAEQVRAGVGVGLDVTRAQSQLSGVRAQLIAARNDRDRTRLDLLRAAGLPLDAPLTLSDSLSTLPLTDTVPAEAQAVARALRARPDLAAARENIQAAQQQVTAIRAERLPTIGVTADEGLVGKYPTNRQISTYTWGLQVSLPVFDGFRREGRLQEQQLVADELATRERDLTQQATVEVRQSILDLASAREQVAAARERLRFAEQEVAQASERFRAGVAGNADVITASISLNSSRTLVIDALTAFQSARVSLARAQGAVTELP